MGNAVNLFIRSAEEVRLLEENKMLKMKVERLTIELNGEKERRKEIEEEKKDREEPEEKIPPKRVV